MIKEYSKEYSTKVLNDLIAAGTPSIFILDDGSVHIGTLSQSYRKTLYRVNPLTINDGGFAFSKGSLKRIVYFNGLVVSKGLNDDPDVLDIFELNDLVNKAGYEFL